MWGGEKAGMDIIGRTSLWKTHMKQYFLEYIINKTSR